MNTVVSRLAVVVAVVGLVAFVLTSGLGTVASRAISAIDLPTSEPSRADGVVPDDRPLSPFDESSPAIARLDPALRTAMQRAAADAEDDGVPFVVTSGWRSAGYQQRLLDQAEERYGSAAEAARWVSTPTQSEHVKGRAVDIGFTDADSWLQQHGSRYGLCRMYANEMWHFELATEAGGECPAPWPTAADRYGAGARG